MNPSESESREQESSVSDQTIRQAPDGVDAAVELSQRPAVSGAGGPRVPGYTPTELLGRGAYGEVWRAEQRRTKKQVAVKIFLQRGGLDWIFLQREVERLTRLDRHPHIVTLLDTDLGSDPPFYVMDLIEEGSLDQFVGGETKQSHQQVVEWMRQICEALAYVHGKGLIHCDLKPANILVDEQGHVRVVDFGQSRVFTESSASLGTLYYMAPEQARLGEPGKPVQPDIRWDVYALGATIYAILFGHAPRASSESDHTLQEAATLTERLERYRMLSEARPVDLSLAKREGVDRDFMAIVGRCLATDPEERYDTTTAVLADLDAMRECRPVSPLAGSRAYRVKKFLQRNTFKIGLISAVMILIPSLYIARQNQANADAADARTILERFIYDPEVALARVESASGALREYLGLSCRESLSSGAAPRRAMGAAGCPRVDADAFWESVDGGTLWKNGEWLELPRVDWPEVGWLVDMLMDKAGTGSDMQKYVSFCLLGQLVLERPDGVTVEGESFRRLCESAVRESRSAGVVSAAVWAAVQMGEALTPESRDLFYVDDLTGLTFAKVHAVSGFRRGADSSDRDQLRDERRIEKGVDIGELHFSTTEVTLSAIEPFVTSSASSDIPSWSDAGADRRTRVRMLLKERSVDQQKRVAAGWMNLLAARKYCDWLNEQVSDRRYRLPTEDEWEYACRGRNAGRFCYGNDAKYAPMFANCNGESPSSVHEVGRKMPNWYGLFDMHGGLWELCDSRYEAEFLTEEESRRHKEVFVWRGGGYYGSAVRCRSTQRNISEAIGTSRYVGVRLVLEFDAK
jgi:serine/threonine protein kinase